MNVLSALVLTACASLASPTLDVSARFAPARTEAEVGEPVAWVLEIDHDADESVALAEEAAPEPTSWVQFEQSPPTTTAHPTDVGRVRTRFEFVLARLVPGAWTPEAPYVDVTGAGASAGVRRVRPEVGTLEVVGLLGPNEDRPRPTRGFREPTLGEAEAATWPFWVAGLLFALGLFAFLRARQRRRVPRVAGPTPIQRLLALEGAAFETEEGVQRAHFELTRCVRDAFGARFRAQAPGMTDDEWLRSALADPALQAWSQEQRAELDALFGACAEVKYGGARPTHWATQERVRFARSLLERASAGLERETAEVAS